MVSSTSSNSILSSNKKIDLVTYCVKQNVPFTIFETWDSILADVKKIVSGKKTVQQVSAEGVENFKKGGNEKS